MKLICNKSEMKKDWNNGTEFELKEQNLKTKTKPKEVKT